MAEKNLRILPKLRDSLSYTYFEHAKIEKNGNAIAVFCEEGETHVPVAALGVLMLGPGTSITHDAVKVCAENGCTILWVGEYDMRMYAMGVGETRSARRLLRQIELYQNPNSHAAIALKMYEMRFGEKLEEGLTLQQIRGKEGVRVRDAYAKASIETGIEWKGRNYDKKDWQAADSINRALSAAASCLYGVCHCAIVSAGYSTAIGFIHTGKMLSFVYDIADLYRVDIIVPASFRATAEYKQNMPNYPLEREVRLKCREAFREFGLLERVVSDIDKLMQINSTDLSRAQQLVDGETEDPCRLWAPDGEDIEGGKNYGDTDN